jgi:hypothetical protein
MEGTVLTVFQEALKNREAKKYEDIDSIVYSLGRI